jgi:methionyl-tRNA synthetase
MPERIFIGVAWPYVSGWPHLGHVAGVYLPADIFARYHRLAGNEVLMVSGSDEHGTPITVRADQEGKTPKEIADRYHDVLLWCWEKLGISWDLYTRTGTDNHRQVAQDMFKRLLGQGYIFEDTTPHLYCETDKRFLPDRYVEGRCPNCGFDRARGDQCDNCGRPLDALDLGNPLCRLCGGEPVVRQSAHFFLALDKFSDRLREWVSQQHHWRPNVRNFTLGMIDEGLKPRPITRDITWGVPIPLPGYEDKRIYVWFEAVCGYLSASKEWAARKGEPDAWRRFWDADSGVKAYYFIGKDNIPFHTIIWPAMLMGYGGLALPFDVPANEYLNFKGQQFSRGRNWAVWLPDYLERHPPDPLRFVLCAEMPETQDNDFTWEKYQSRVNNELVATYGNFVHRVLTFARNNFEGKVPSPGELGPEEKELLSRCELAFEEVGKELEACRFRNALKAALSLAQKANGYLNVREPWEQIKSDRQAAATTIWTAVQVVSALRIIFWPTLPFSSEKLAEYLQEDPRPERWAPKTIEPGTPIGPVQPLFKKVDDALVEEENARIGTVSG